MFDLEQAITAWRVQMRAANLTPNQLVELEAHLHEDIARHLRVGMPVPQAFATAAAQIGAARDLGAEFRHADGVTNTYRMLGLLWFIYCAGSFYHTTSGLMTYAQSAGFHVTALFALGVLFNFIYLRGLIASVQLFEGNQNARWFILFLAAFDALGGVGVLLTKSPQPMSVAFTILGFVTLWLLWPRHHLKTVTQ
jgi:hypothetical protein